ncbi:SDR family oxidoreductase [Nocardia sp. FBN12]|uniref:SDR family oxidoreductase n=1 Tax=Nocardia sp. FBN12 TaxID=3419766 RepID=UPI003CFDBB42
MKPRTVLITGAGSGFGRGAALILAARGHDVIASVRNDAQRQDLETQAQAEGLSLRVPVLELTSESDRDAALGWNIDVLVNNAAIGAGGPISEIPLQRVREVFEVNVFATLALTQPIAAQMVERGRGRIVFVSSIAGLTAGAYLGAYASSKHALEAIAESMADELAPHGIQVATLNPGPFATGFNDAMIASIDEWFSTEQNFTRPEDLASLKERFANQFPPDSLIEEMVGLVEADSGPYRTIDPAQSAELVRSRQERAWTRQQSPAVFGEGPA